MNAMNPTGRQKALDASAARAAESLSRIDMSARCRLLDLPPPDAGGGVMVPVLGRDLLLMPPEYRAVDARTDAPGHPVDRVLALHYLLCESPVRPSGTGVSFRDLPGGQFYWEAFRSRAVLPLERFFGNDLRLLRERLDRLAWAPLPQGDIGASVRGAGKIDVMLVYRAGNDEFPASADIFFDSCILHVYDAADSAELAGRVCAALLRP
jgi:hypothetical protein